MLHPHSTVSATAGPVEIAEGVVIWERAVVGSLGGSSSTTVLEKNVVVETGAGIGVGARVGEGSVVECFAKVGSGAQVGKVSFFFQTHHCKSRLKVRSAY